MEGCRSCIYLALKNLRVVIDSHRFYSECRRQWIDNPLAPAYVSNEQAYVIFHCRSAYRVSLPVLLPLAKAPGSHPVTDILPVAEEDLGVLPVVRWHTCLLVAHLLDSFALPSIFLSSIFVLFFALSNNSSILLLPVIALWSASICFVAAV